MVSQTKRISLKRSIMNLSSLVGCSNIKIMNLRKLKPSEPYDFRIDRPSPLSNPFRSTTEGGRDACCDKYDKTFIFRLLHRTDMQQVINQMIKIHHEYGQIRIFCWCVPKRCHGETIVKHLKKIIEG